MSEIEEEEDGVLEYDSLSSDEDLETLPNSIGGLHSQFSS